LLLFVGSALGQETKLKWFGHAAFSITTSLRRNPSHAGSLFAR
jgi:hypothetical protein